MTEKQAYNADSIKILEGLEGVRKRFDVVELSKKIKKKGDVFILSKELKIRPRILNSAIQEGRILRFLPNIEKSKAGILASLRTKREIELFSKKYNLNEISARKLIKLVRQWKEDIQKNPMLLLNQEEHDLIIGSLMGDSCIRQREKNSCFRVAHSIKQGEYLNLKYNILKNFEISEFDKRSRIINNRKVDMIYLSTKTHQIFNYYRNLFYQNGRKIVSKDILNQLNAKSLAYWICDDGSFCQKQKYIIICTNAYTLEEHNLMKEFFNNKFGLNPTIGFRDRKYYYLRFKQDDSKKLIQIIKPFISPFMSYKIGVQNG